MSNDEILKALGEIMSDVLDREGIVFARSTVARDVPGWDSFENIRFIVEVERKFDLAFASGDVLELKNVGEFVDLISRSLASK